MLTRSEDGGLLNWITRHRLVLSNLLICSPVCFLMCSNLIWPTLNKSNWLNFVHSVAEWLTAPLLRQPGLKGLWFNPHPRCVVASLDKTIYNDYLCFVGYKLGGRDFKLQGNLRSELGLIAQHPLNFLPSLEDNGARKTNKLKSCSHKQPLHLAKWN